VDKIEDQAAPISGEVEVGELVLSDMRDRIALGQERYGSKLKTFNGRDALVDAYQEAIDLVMYLRQEIEERNSAQETVLAVIEIVNVFLHYTVSIKNVSGGTEIGHIGAHHLGRLLNPAVELIAKTVAANYNFEQYDIKNPFDPASPFYSRL